MRAAGALLAMWAAGAAWAQPALESGTLQVSKTVLDESGGPGFSSADGYSMAFSLGQPAIGLLQDGSTQDSGGFYGGAGSGLRGRRPRLGILGQPSVNLYQETYLGLPCVSSLTLTFDKLMIPGRLPGATELVWLRDRLAREINEPVPFSLAYDPALNRMELSSSSGCWPANSLYQVRFSSHALDFEGLPVPPVTTQLYTLADPAQENIVVSPAEPQTRVGVAPGAFAAPFYVQFNLSPQGAPESVPAGAIEEANRKARGTVVLAREVQAKDASHQALATSFGPGQVSLLAPYPDADANGFVDGFGAAARERTLAWHRLDEGNRLWVRLPGSQPDADADTLSAAVPGFSAFAAIAAQDLAVAEAYAFPVPFRPNGSQAGPGPGRTGTEAAGITFANLPSAGTVEVYNVRGELVWRGEESDGDGRLAWDVRNSAGEKVASGVYLFVVRSAQDRKVGKLAIVR